MSTAIDPAPRPAATTVRGGRARLAAGILGRTWLWFVAGCILVTVLPMLLGWRPYVVQSGSMEPRIAVGDIVLAAPVSTPDELLGRVAVFDDPDRLGSTKTHRVVEIAPDGAMTTKGDANPTIDTSTITLSSVHGLGRLLVTYAGLPLIWLHTHQYVPLSLLVLSLLLSAWFISRDRDEDEPDDEGPGGDLLPLPAPSSSAGAASAQAASRPVDPDPGKRRGGRGLLRVGLRLSYAFVLPMMLLMPSTAAAMLSTTGAVANRWTTGSWSTAYTTMVKGLSPWLYWKLDETGGASTAADSSGQGRPGSYVVDGSSTYVTQGVTGALTGNSPNLGVTLTSSSSCIVTSSTSGTSAPSQFTAIVWFKSTTTAGGKLLGFESPRTGVTAYSSGGRYDRMLYLDASGKVWFGAANGQTIHAISSSSGKNDGSWHMAAGVLSSSGMRLYLDGTQVATDTFSNVSSYTGWWRAGCGNLSGWGSAWDGGSSPSGSWNQPRDFPFAGSLDEITIWNSPLTATQVAALYGAR